MDTEGRTTITVDTDDHGFKTYKPDYFKEPPKDTAGVFASALVLGMLIGMAILYVINMFHPVVKQVTNEEVVFKEGVSQGCAMTIYVANRGMTNIPIDQVVSEAWKIRQGKK